MRIFPCVSEHAHLVPGVLCAKDLHDKGDSSYAPLKLLQQSSKYDITAYFGVNFLIGFPQHHKRSFLTVVDLEEMIPKKEG
jgi:hypothetical protein